MWRVVVLAAEGRPEVELNEYAVRLKFKNSLTPVTLEIPQHALPLNPDEAKCKFSQKRGELLIEWSQSCIPDLQANSTSMEPNLVAAPDMTKQPLSDTVPVATSTEPASDPSKVVQHAPDVQDAVAAEPVATKSAEEWRSAGNEAVKTGDLEEAIRCYSAGLSMGEEALLYSNRALCLHKLDRNTEAIDDAKRCVALRPDFFKGYLRGAKALQAMSHFEEALAFLKRCPPHDEAAALASELRPQAEAAEQARIASLGGAEKSKEEGNVLFRKGLFEDAASKYTEALEKVEDSHSTLALAIRNNRAACFHQLSDFGSVVKDTSFVIEQDPGNTKALMRRMLALEPLERYEAALEDARAVLRQDPRHEAANKMQHRLSKLVRDLQRAAGA